MISIEAFQISNKKIYYICPFCWTNGKNYFNTNTFKNGKICESRLPSIHHHGNETKELGDFVTHRSNHCNFSNEDVQINITENTERI